MTNEMDEFEKLLKTETPAPDADAKKAALLRGLEAFDQEFSKNRQGSRTEGRLMDALRNFHNTLFGGQTMKTRHLLAGTAIVLVGIAMLNTSYSPVYIGGKDIATVDKAKKSAEKVAPAQLRQTMQLAPGELPAPPVAAPAYLAGAAANSPAPTSNSITPGELPAPPQADADVGSYSSKTSPMQYYSPKVSGFQLGANQAAPDLSHLQSPPVAEKNSGGLHIDIAAPMAPSAVTVASDNRVRGVFIPKAPMAKEEERTASHPIEAYRATVPPSSPVLSPPPPPPIAAPPLADVVTNPANKFIASTPNYSAPGMPVSPAVLQAQVTDDKFEKITVNPPKLVKDEPVSTFSTDVNTSSYSYMRASLNNNTLPQPDSIRVEELINYFPYNYALPEDREAPFKANVDVMPTPWNNSTKLIHIGIKGYDIAPKEKPHANLVFLIDTSGSMDEPNKLPLLKASLRMLLDTLQPSDRVSIVTYAGNSGVALGPTSVSNKATILSVIDNLQAWGSTAGADGITLAYQQAAINFDKEGINRVILATDGDFNVGVTDKSQLKTLIEHERDTGIYLSVLGFGMGNYNDATMQMLAQNGNGNAAYIDNVNEAQKALVQESGSTLFTIAKDVKIQVEFNPAKVSDYRLIGYETRMLKREDFNNDRVDAGDIGAGHAVTALYEITPADSDSKVVDDLRYAKKAEKKEKPEEASNEYAFVKIRYKLPAENESKLITTVIDAKNESKDVASAPQESRFAAAVAAFGQLLRGDTTIRSFTYEDVIALADGAKGEDKFGYRAQFVNLVRTAEHAGNVQVQPYNGPGYYRPGAAPYNQR